MNKKKTLSIVAIFFLALGVTQADDPPLKQTDKTTKTKLDRTKIAVQIGLKNALQAAATSAKLKLTQKSQPDATSKREATLDPEPAASKARVIKVAPGKVRWHTDLETARKASQKSRKPVLLFQLLGRLDEEFT